MRAFKAFKVEHGDFIHDIAYDYYGRRLATCSADNNIRIWNQTQKGSWVESSVIHKAHSFAVQKISWAHPEFGQVIASCSNDTVNIFEEFDDPTSQVVKKVLWKKKSSLVDSRDAIEHVQFAPRHLGLKLATCSLDGRVRIYECVDVMNLSVWPLVEEFEAAKKDCFCMAWNSSPFDSPMLVIGSERSVKIWEYQEKYQKWRVFAELLGHQAEIRDVAWAPSMGKSYHLIATASEKVVRIYKVYTKFNKNGGNNAESNNGIAISASNSGGNGECTAQRIFPMAEKRDHDGDVWRVAWNITGTLLASTGDDGIARLYKVDYNGVWHSLVVACGRTTDNAQGNNCTSNNDNDNNNNNSSSSSSLGNGGMLYGPAKGGQISNLPVYACSDL